jgi:hypothetical protein
VHVLDASRSVVVVASLLDPQLRDEFAEEVRREYEELRRKHQASQKDLRFVPLARARERRLRLESPLPPPPRFLGVRAFADYPLQRVVELIDWAPFFAVWQLQGTYPHRGYPRLFEDARVGAEARRVFEDAQRMLEDVQRRRLFRLSGVLGFWPANQAADAPEDVELFASEEDREAGRPLARLHGLRQQQEHEMPDQPYLALGDLVAPWPERDYVGAFAVAVHGAEELARHYEAQHDDYRAIMAKALADRLAEAFAETLHREVRREHWGYAPDEQLSPQEMFRTRYQGIRPAPGYPSQPDHTEKDTLFVLLQAENLAQIRLTGSRAMLPASAVCALLFARREARYFAVGKIQRDQVPPPFPSHTTHIRTSDATWTRSLARRIHTSPGANARTQRPSLLLRLFSNAISRRWRTTRAARALHWRRPRSTSAPSWATSTAAKHSSSSSTQRTPPSFPDFAASPSPPQTGYLERGGGGRKNATKDGRPLATIGDHKGIKFCVESSPARRRLQKGGQARRAAVFSRVLLLLLLLLRLEEGAQSVLELVEQRVEGRLAQVAGSGGGE